MAEILAFFQSLVIYINIPWDSTANKITVEMRGTLVEDNNNKSKMW